MVRTDEDIDNLPPEEKLKALHRLKQLKKEELEELLRVKEQEMRAAEQRVADQEEEIQKDIGEAKAEQEKASSEHLEQLVEDAGEEPQGNVNYNQRLEQIPTSIYQFTDYNVYHELADMERRIQGGDYLSRQEQERIRSLQQTSDALRDAYSPQQIHTANEHRGHYLQRTEDVLARLDKKLHDLNSNNGTL